MITAGRGQSGVSLRGELEAGPLAPAPKVRPPARGDRVGRLPVPHRQRVDQRSPAGRPGTRKFAR